MNKKFAAVLAGATLLTGAWALEAPVDPMLHEVTVQCASEVTGLLDAWAEGVDEPQYVPAPTWEELLERCQDEFEAGNDWQGAQDAVLNQYGYRWAQN